MVLLYVVFQASAGSDVAATTSQETDSGSAGDHTPSRPVVTEPEKADRVGCRLSGEFTHSVFLQLSPRQTTHTS